MEACVAAAGTVALSSAAEPTRSDSLRLSQFSKSSIQVKAAGTMTSVSAVEVTLLHTPGHTPGSQCFLVDGKLVAGDTLFLDGCGRTDLPGGDSDELYYSLTQRLATVSDDTVLYPGHLYSPEPFATMGARLKASFLRIAPRIRKFIAADSACAVA